MSIYQRIVNPDESNRIPVHTLFAALAERKRGNLTNAQVAAAFELDSEEGTELLTLWGKVNNDTLTPAEIHDVFILAEAGVAPFNTVAGVKTRLGV